MTLLDQLKKKVAVNNFAGKHPLLRMGVSRDVRDAYFLGVVLAAFVDDNKVDAEERAYLEKMGVALGLLKNDVEESIDRVSEIMKDEQAQSSLAMEIAAALKEPSVAKLFLAEFSLIWTSHTANMEALCEWRNVLVGLMDLELTQEWFDLLDHALTGKPERVKAIARMRDFDKDTSEYLFGESGAKAQMVKVEEEKEQSAKTALKEFKDALVKIVESRRTGWCMSYDKNAILLLARKAGVTDHVISTVLTLLLPEARKAYSGFCQDIPNLTCSRNSTDSTIEVGDSAFGLRLLNYLYLFNVLTTKAGQYSVFGRDNGNRGYPYSREDRYDGVKNIKSVENGCAYASQFCWAWRSKNGEAAARQAIKDLYAQILAEFELRATF